MQGSPHALRELPGGHDNRFARPHALEVVAAELDGDPRITAAVADELRTLERLVRNIANNLNQLAHHANAVRRVVDIGSVFAELKRLDAAVRSYTRNRLG